MNTQKTSMTEGSIPGILLRFALPLLLGGLFQQLYNAVDSLVVGRFCGDSALAAVSSSGNLCFLLIGFFQGLFMGASVVISNRYGAKDDEGVDRAVHATVFFSLVTGILVAAAGVLLTPTILRWMGTPENVMPNSVTYFRIYCIGLPALVLYNTSNGIFQALGDSRHPLYYLIISSIANVILDLLFVAVFDWGVAGAAMATVLGQLLSTILGFAHLMSGRFIVRVRLSHIRPDLKVLRRVLRMGLPSGIQSSVIAIANVVVQSNINAFGDLAMAGCGSYSRVEAFVFLPISSINMAITTFISQNLGANRRDRAVSCARIGMGMNAGIAQVIGILFFIFAPYLIGIFSDTPEVIAIGVRQARVETLFFFVLGFAHAAASVLRGSGRAISPMVIMLSVWCLFRIIYITVMVRYIPDITVVFTAYPVTWTISSVIFIIVLKMSHWSEKTALEQF